MSVKLIGYLGYGGYPSGSIVEFPASTESALIASGQAVASAGPATIGPVTTNSYQGSVTFAAGASSLVVTNENIAAQSLVHAYISQAAADATALRVERVVAAAGSFTIYLSAAATSAVSVKWALLNYDGPVVRTVAASTSQAQQLRVVTVNNHMNTGVVSSAGKDSWIGTLDYYIGSGDVDGIVLSWDGWSTNGGSYQAAPSTYTINKVGAENAARTVATAVTFDLGANQNKTINPGDSDIQADVILPASLGKTRFTVGEKIYITVDIKLPVAGASLVGQAGRHINANVGTLIGWYDSAATTIGNITGPGAFTVTGAALGAASNSAVPMPKGLGYFSDGADPLTLFMWGDSIGFGFKDITTFSPKGYGIFQRVLIGNGTDAQLLAGLNFSMTGITIAGLGSDPRISDYAKYCREELDEIGTNTFSTTGTVTSASVIASERDHWALMRSKGISKIHRTKLGVRTTGAGVLVDQSDQIPVAGWVAGAAVDTFNNVDLPAELAAGRINTLIAMTLWRGSPNPWKWPATGSPNTLTDDLLHPLGEAGNAPLAAEIRAAIAP